MAKNGPSSSFDSPPADSLAQTDPNQATSGSKPDAGLYLVATPIGNLGDLTFRARDLLQAAAVIACEDTRVTQRLLDAYAIKTPLATYHEHNAKRMRPALIKRIKNGEVVALVSDAGTPLISDPGYKLVRAVVDERLAVTVLPGASAVLAGLTLSGLPTDRFLFAGFLPPKQTARRKAIAELAGIPASLVFYEAGARLAATLAALAEGLGLRQGALARELTKKFEEVRRGPLPELAAQVQTDGPPKGEIVIIVGPPDAAEARWSDAQLDDALAQALETGSTRDAVAAITQASGRPKREVYARALALQEPGD